MHMRTEDKIAKYGLKPVDAWWTVLVIDPIAIPMVDALRNVRWITPNLISFASIASGVGSAAAFASTQFILGALLYQLRFLLDCVDGKLARVRGQGSRLGWYLDHRTAFPVMTLMLAGWSYGLYRVDWHPYWSVILTSYLVAFANYLLFANEAIGGGGGATARPLWGRLYSRPTVNEFETLVYTVFPILLALESRFAAPVLWIGIAGFLLYTAYMQAKDVRSVLSHP
jgi:phosphatidylglycerophosphate synthase